MGNFQLPDIGVCIVHGSVPKFIPVERFIQILNVGDHFICATNTFSRTFLEVYIYDSMYEVIPKSAVLQVTSLLRNQEADAITFRIRNFGKQRNHSRTCGFYAVAAAISIFNQVDPTGNIYDEIQLIRGVRDRLADKIVTQIPPVRRMEVKDILVERKQKLHCICHSVSHGKMIQCDHCLTWFHEQCVIVPQQVLRQEALLWFGPCCKNYNIDAENRRQLL